MYAAANSKLRLGAGLTYNNACDTKFDFFPPSFPRRSPMESLLHTRSLSAASVVCMGWVQCSGVSSISGTAALHSQVPILLLRRWSTAAISATRTMLRPAPCLGHASGGLWTTGQQTGQHPLQHLHLLHRKCAATGTRASLLCHIQSSVHHHHQRLLVVGLRGLRRVLLC